MIIRNSILILLTAGFFSSCYGQVELDGFYERVIKKSNTPQNISTERYRQEQLIRLREVLDEITSEDEPEVHRRRKRAVDDGFLANMNIGFYKQDTLLLDKFSALTSTSEQVATDGNFMIQKVVEYNDASDVKSLLRITASRASGISVEVYDSGTWTSLSNDGSSFDDFITTSDTALTITDIEMGNNPASVFNFLCITVDYDDGYPRTPTEFIHEKDINLPLDVGDKGKSLLINFDIDMTTQTYGLSSSLLDTIHARDCEFWVADEKLMIGIAQYGNLQTDQPRQKSKIYYQTSPDVSFFQEFLSEDDSELFTTYRAERVLPFRLDGQSCVFFVNSWDGVNESPIYCYNFQDTNFALLQNVRTFGAKDAAILSIRDTYPVNSENFLIVCNGQEKVGDSIYPVSPTVFKRQKGRFVAYQTLSDISSCENIRSFAMQSEPQSLDTELPNFQTLNFKHFIAVAGVDRVSNGNFLLNYQFDGKRFVKQGTDIELSSYVLNTLSSVYDLNPSAHELRLSYRLNTGIMVKKPTFEAVSHEFGTKTHAMLVECLEKSKLRLENQNPTDLYNLYSLAPQKVDLTSGIQIDDLTFDGSLAVENTKVFTQNNTNLKFAVDGLQSIEDSYPERVTSLNTLVTESANNFNSLISMLGGPDSVKTGQDNSFTGPIKLSNVVGTELGGDKVTLIDDEFYILKDNNADATTIDTMHFYSNIFLIKGDNVVESGYLMNKELTMENIEIDEGYDIEKISDSLVLDYVDSSQESVSLTGTVTLDANCVFNAEINADTVNSAAFNQTTVILREGDQTIENLHFGNTVNFNTIHLSNVNGADLDIVEEALIVESDLTISEDLTVNTFTVDKVTAKFKADDSVKGQNVLYFDDLLNNHMKLAADSNVDILHHYSKTVTVDDIPVSDINDSQWPEHYVKIHGGSLEHSNIVTIDQTSFTNGIKVKEEVTDGTNSLNVIPEVWKLPVVPLSGAESVTLEETKSFNTINLNSHGTVNEELQGLTPADLLSRVTIGEKQHSGSLTVSTVLATGTHEITTLELQNSGTIKSECSTECVDSNLGNLFNNKGIKRAATHINTVDLTFEKAEFTSDVEVALIDGINPGEEWVTLDGSSERILNDVSFKSVVNFNNDLTQVEDKLLVACEDNAVRRIYCKPELCDSGDSSCELVNKECLVKSGINDETLCRQELSENIKYVWDNSLKNDEAVTLSRSVYFHAGFEANEIEIRSGDECTLNNMNCLNVATTTYDEEYLGEATFKGGVTFYKSAVIEDLTIQTGIVNSINIEDMYADTLYLNSEYTQELSDVFFENKFEVDAFTSNGVTIDTTPADDLTNRESNVPLNSESDESLLSSKLILSQPATAASLAVTTFDGVDMRNYRNNKVTLADGQTITSDLTVNGDLTFQGAANQGGSWEDTKVNGFNLNQLDSELARIGSNTLSFNDVNFDNIVAKNGVVVNDELVGLSVPSDVVYETASTLTFDASKEFSNVDTEIFNGVNLESSTWKKNSAAAVVSSEKLLEFLDNDNLENVNFESVTFANEPAISNFNGLSITQRINDVWMNDRTATIEFNTKFDSLTAKSDFIMASGNEKINTIDITDLNNYVSITDVPEGPADGPADVTFQAGLTVQSLRVPTVSLEDNLVEKAVHIGATIIEPKDLQSRAIYLDGTNGVLPSAKLTIDNIDVNIVELDDGQTTNDIDLSDQALNYVDGKVFPGALTITSNLVVENLGTDSGLDTLKFKFSTERDDESHFGVSASNGVLSVDTWGSVKSNAIYNDNNAVTISGTKTFSGSVDIPTLSVSGKLDTVTVGDCTTPNILLDSPCTGSIPQSVTGSWTFNQDVAANTVTLTKLQNEDFNALKAKFVYRGGEDAITFTGSNTFVNGLQISEASTFAAEKLAFGADVAGLKTYAEGELDGVDMSYESGDIPPHVTDILINVKKESERVPETFLYVSRIEWTETVNKAILISLDCDGNSFPINLLGVEVSTPPSTGKLTMYTLPTNYADNEINILGSAIDVEVQIKNEDEMDMLCLYHDDNKRIILYKEFIPIDSGSPENLPLNVATATIGFLALAKLDVSGGELVQTVLQYGHAGVTIEDYESVIIGTKKCVAICLGTTGVSVLCLNSDFKLETLQNIDGDCTQVTATPTIMSHGENQAFLAIANNNPAVNEKNARVYKYDDDSAGFKQVHTGIASGDIKMKLFGFIDTVTGDDAERIFLVFYPGAVNSLDILEFSAASQKFEMFDGMPKGDVKDVDFSIINGKVEMHVLSLEGDHSTINTYTNRGFAKFSSYGPTEVVKMHKSVTRINVHVHFDQKKFVSVAGPTKYENSVLLGYVNKFNDDAAARTEFQNSANLPPEFITTECHLMVANNLKKLYDENEFELDLISNMFFRLQPHDHITYRTTDFPETIKNILEDSKFTSLLAPQQPTSVANIYKYISGERTPSDASYMGSVLVYQEQGSVAYVYSRLLTDRPTFHAISFWTSCESAARKSTHAIYSGASVEPMVVDDSDGVSKHMCGMVHSLATDIQTRLDALDNKNDAGAIVIHETDSEDSDRLGCGYLKKPTTAKIQFLRDHNEAEIGDSRSRAMCTFDKIGEGDVTGTLLLDQEPGQNLIIKGVLSGLIPNQKQGFHIHAEGSLDDNCKAAGGHFNPFGRNHGGSMDEERHVGDLENIQANSNGELEMNNEYNVPNIFDEENSVIGKAMVIHAGEDDLGQGGDEGSKKTGNAGNRWGCCIIQRRPPYNINPFIQYTA